MNGMMVLGWSIYSKVASFGWNSRKSFDSRSYKDEDSEEVAKIRTRRDSIHRSGMVGECSFADAVKGIQLGGHDSGDKK